MKNKELKEKIIAVLEEQGFKINPHVRPAICDKQAYKDVQQRSRLEQIAAHHDFLQRFQGKAQQYCRSGDDISPNNTISLCVSCHAKTNYNKEKWIIVFSKIIDEMRKVE